MNVVVLISGGGTNLQALIDNQSGYQIVGVISNVAGVYGLHRAQNANIPTLTISATAYRNRLDFDSDLAEMVKSFQPDLVVLAGWMRILSMNFLKHFPNQVVNLHPALPGTFPGVNAIQRAWGAYGDRMITQTGVMVHFVSEQVDEGPVIVQREINILPSDSLSSLTDRIHQVEHELIVQAVKSLARGKEPT